MADESTRRRVLVTRSAAQAAGLAEALRAAGLEPVVLPVLSFAPPTSCAALDAALRCLDAFDWMVLTSANAAEAMGRRASKLGVRIAAGRVRVAAVGGATARAAEEYLGLVAAMVSPRPVAESLAEVLVEAIRQRAEAGASRVLVVRAEQGREVIERELAAAGAEVTVAAAYCTVVPPEALASLSAMAASGDWPAAVTFTSPSAARHLLALLEAAGVGLPAEVLRVSVGPVTTAALRALGIPAHAEASDPSAEALAKAVLLALAG